MKKKDAEITQEGLDIKEGSLEVKDSTGKTVMSTDEKGNVKACGEFYLKSENIGYINTSAAINLGKNPKFIIDDKEYTPDDIINVLADKVVDRLRGGIKFATPSAD